MNNALHPQLLRSQALAIWQAGVAAVTPQQLFSSKVRREGTCLFFDEVEVELQGVRRILVVGAGKASAAMAQALEEQILQRLDGPLANIEITGWINAPAGTFTAPLRHIHLHAARPAGVNSPTAAGIAGTRRILELVQAADERDLVLCLISGGGSALLVAPTQGISLEDKQAVASLIAAAGGNIAQLNCVRRALSDVKGGGLARECRAGELITLILSDVLGDPLDVIASGPTILMEKESPTAALQVLHELHIAQDPRLQNVLRFLQAGHGAQRRSSAFRPTRQGQHIILGNNADAVDAAGVKAVELGYRYVMQSASQPEGDVLSVARTATSASLQVMSQPQIDCWISGGEPTVALPQVCGRGGRNQQLALAVLEQLVALGWPQRPELREFAFCSGGTDGEDGPTDAAGACFDRTTWEKMQQLQLEPAAYLERADAYTFFEQVQGLMITGPTGTNVCDLRVALCCRG